MLWNIIYAQYGYSLKGKFSKINLLEEKNWGKILNLTNPIICHSRRGSIFFTFVKTPLSGWKIQFLWNHGNKIYIYLSCSISSFFYIVRYVLLVESLVNEVFSLHQRGEDGLGTYGRRSGDHAGDQRTVMVPPHLYGQLALTKQGLELLLAENAFWEMLVLVQEIGAGNYRWQYSGGHNVGKIPTIMATIVFSRKILLCFSADELSWFNVKL